MNRPKRYSAPALVALVAASAACARSSDDSRADSAPGVVATAANDDMGARAVARPDERMQLVLDELQALGPKPIPQLTAKEARQQPTPADAAKQLLQKEGKSTAPDAAVSSMDRTIPGAAGPLPARVYKPKDASGPLPVVVYYHGGGWVIADKAVYDGGARSISKTANAIVVSVDYRQGPEHRFPAAHDDAFAAYQWVVKNAASLGGDPKRVAVAGESAGGGLAVATAMMARDRKVQMPIAVVSVYPIAGTDTTTPSYEENAAAKPLDRPMMSWFFANYLRGAEDREDPRVNLVAADLSGLPPTTIINAQIDPLRSEGEMLAERLRDAGVEVEQRTYQGVTHEFFGMGMVHEKALDAEKQAGDALRRAFGG